jgi:hypothetical protein
VPALAYSYVIVPLYFPGNQGSFLASLLNEFFLYQELPVFFVLKAWPVTNLYKSLVFPLSLPFSLSKFWYIDRKLIGKLGIARY